MFLICNARRFYIWMWGFVSVCHETGVIKSNENVWWKLTILPNPERIFFFLRALNAFHSHHLKWWGKVIKTKIKRLKPLRKFWNAKVLVFNSRLRWLISVSILKPSCMLTQLRCLAVLCLCSSCQRKWKDNSYCFAADVYCDWFIVSLLGRNTCWSYKFSFCSTHM